jgi:hypothetical protein
MLTISMRIAVIGHVIAVTFNRAIRVSAATILIVVQDNICQAIHVILVAQSLQTDTILRQTHVTGHATVATTNQVIPVSVITLITVV